ncbi:MAG TPA: hypothetical protein VMY80_05245 [Anaerolineae bacterium]|nr:hypothetical protein [Anaerolineae bacterium]
MSEQQSKGHEVKQQSESGSDTTQQAPETIVRLEEQQTLKPMPEPFMGQQTLKPGPMGIRQQTLKPMPDIIISPTGQMPGVEAQQQPPQGQQPQGQQSQSSEGSGESD